jgi:mevalonate kinase
VLVRNAKLAIEAGDHAALGQLLDLNHTILSSLMLCTTKLEEMCQAARRAGALGAKMTGAGGGGCMFALAPKHDVAVRLREVLGAGAFVAEVGT